MEFFYLINSLTFFRLFFLFRDNPLTLRTAVLLSILQIIPLFVLIINPVLIGFAVFILIINLLLFYFEKSGRLNGYRFLSFLLLFISAGLFTSEYFALEFNKSLIESLKSASALTPSFLKLQVDFSQVLKLTFGALVLLNEINFFIRFFFEALNLYPVNTIEKIPVDEKEYNAGRVIGMLERIFIFTLVLIGEITVIGFIIAAKGFTRFKELDKRDFAEYVLIGTLLSSFFALVVAFFIKAILIF